MHRGSKGAALHVWWSWICSEQVRFFQRYTVHTGILLKIMQSLLVNRWKFAQKTGKPRGKLPKPFIPVLTVQNIPIPLKSLTKTFLFLPPIMKVVSFIDFYLAISSIPEISPNQNLCDLFLAFSKYTYFKLFSQIFSGFSLIKNYNGRVITMVVWLQRSFNYNGRLIKWSLNYNGRLITMVV